MARQFMTLEKLRTLIIAEATLKQATIEEAVEFLRQKSVELDPEQPDLTKKGIQFILRRPPAAKAPVIDNLHLSNATLEAAAKAIAKETGLALTMEPGGVIFSAPGGEPELLTVIYSVPPDFLNLDGGGKRESAQKVLEEAGITFPEYATAYFNSETGTLSVRNTRENLDLTGLYVEHITARQPKMINLRAEFYQMPKADALALLDQLDSMSDAGAGVAKLREIAATSEKIKLLAAPSLHTRSGQKVQTQSGQGRAPVPLENNKPGSAPPVGAASGEFTGSSFSASATLGGDGKTLDITADFVFGAPSNTPNAEPNVGSLSTNTTMFAGQTRLAGTLSGGEHDDTMILVFLKASLAGSR